MKQTPNTPKTKRIPPAQRIAWLRLAEKRDAQGRPDLAAACRNLANR